MKNEDYTLEYYLERDKQRKIKNHLTYLRKKYKLTPEEYDTIRINRKNEILSTVLEMCQKGFKAREIAQELGVVMVTVFKYKKILRERGFNTDAIYNYPSTK